MATKRHESAARIASRKRREAARRLIRAEARKRRDAARKRLRAEERKRRDAIRKALRHAEIERKIALKRVARELADEKRDAAAALLRAQRRALLRQRYVTGMSLNSRGKWSWYKVVKPKQVGHKVHPRRAPGWNSWL